MNLISIVVSGQKSVTHGQCEIVRFTNFVTDQPPITLPKLSLQQRLDQSQQPWRIQMYLSFGSPFFSANARRFGLRSFIHRVSWNCISLIDRSLVTNPRHCIFQSSPNTRQIRITERLGILPITVLVLVRSNSSYVVPRRSRFSTVQPYARDNSAYRNFLNGVLLFFFHRSP